MVACEVIPVYCCCNLNKGLILRQPVAERIHNKFNVREMVTWCVCIHCPRETRPNTHRVFFPHFVATARIEFPAPTAECAAVQFWIFFFSLPSRNTTEHAPRLFSTFCGIRSHWIPRTSNEKGKEFKQKRGKFANFFFFNTFSQKWVEIFRQKSSFSVF